MGPHLLCTCFSHFSPLVYLLIISLFTSLSSLWDPSPPLSVYRIDDNVDEALTNVEAAHSELLKYFKGITSNRWLMVKIFIVVIVFFIIFIVFLT